MGYLPNGSSTCSWSTPPTTFWTWFVSAFYSTNHKRNIVLTWLQFLTAGLPGGKLQLADARKYFRQLISAVKYLHELGIAHRDIKPDNMLIDADGQLRLADFGEATRFRDGVREQFMMNVRGTESYMAPEIFSQDAYRAPAADIWACAVTLIALLSGKFPWEKAEDKDPCYAYWKATGGLSRLDRYLNPETKEFLRFLMAVDPDQRPSAAEIEEHPWLKE